MANKPGAMAKFLIEMGSAAEKVDALKKDPDAVLKNFNLSAEEAEAVKKSIKTKDPQHVMKHVTSEDKKKHGNIQINCIL